MNKSRTAKAVLLLIHLFRLALAGSAHGASAFASTAGDALIRIDDVQAITFGDRFDGALGSASAAHNASIANLISHFVTSYKL